MKIYVYAQLHNEIIFYIGMGVKDRPYDVHRRNAKWKAFYKEIGKFEVEILGVFNNRKDARDLERRLIDEHLPPCNIWTKNYRFSEESNRARAEKIRVRPVQDLTRVKLSKSRKVYIEKAKKDGTYKPRPRPSESEIARTVERCSIPIICLNNGVTYKSSREAGRVLGISFKLIHRVAMGHRSHTYGYRFVKLSEYVST